MFLVNVQEAFGMKPDEILDSSLSFIRAMLAEYSYMWNERNREDTEDENGEFEWIELPDWDNPGKMNRIKKYSDVGSFMGAGK